MAIKKIKRSTSKKSKRTRRMRGGENVMSSNQMTTTPSNTSSSLNLKQKNNLNKKNKKSVMNAVKGVLGTMKKGINNVAEDTFKGSEETISGAKQLYNGSGLEPIFSKVPKINEESGKKAIKNLGNALKPQSIFNGIQKFGQGASNLITGKKQQTVTQQTTPMSSQESGKESLITQGGGKKKKRSKSKKRKMRGGSGQRIPGMSDAAPVAIQKIVDGSVNTLNGFFKTLETRFNESIKNAESVKISGVNMFAQTGGKKKRSSSKKRKVVKKKRSSSKKRSSTKKRKMRGGDGSDYATTLSSRGPANYPDNGWAPGELMFRQFSKTGDYIPNSQLPFAAAPQSTTNGIPPGGIVKGFDNLGQEYAPVNFNA